MNLISRIQISKIMKNIQVTLLSILVVTLVSCSQNNEKSSNDYEKSVIDSTLLVVDKKYIPAPMGASEELRNSIISMSPPSYEESQIFPQNNEEWKKLRQTRDSATSIVVNKLAGALLVKMERMEINGVVVRYITPNEIDPEYTNSIFVHTHGGGYVFNGGDAGAFEAILIAANLKIPTISIDYRMPPDHPFPIGLNDVIAAYEGIMGKYKNRTIFMGGSSGGGNFTMSAILMLADKGIQLPKAIFLGTPGSEFNKIGDSFFINEGIDRALGTWDGFITAALNLYANGTDFNDPYISPIYGDLTVFPPTILVSGTRDLLLSSTVRTHRKLRDSGVVTDLVVIEGHSHADYMTVPNAPESIAVYRDIDNFFRNFLNNK